MLQVARRSKWAVASVIAATAMGGFAATQSQAKLVIDVKALSIVAGGTGTISADGKTVTGASVGTKINYQVTGQIVFAGDTDPTDLDGFPVQDDLITSVEGVLASNGPGSIQVDLTHAVNPGSTNPASRNFGNNFADTGSANGVPTNLGGDADTDIGPSLSPLNGASGNISYRSSGATGDAATNLNILTSSATGTTAGPTLMTITNASGGDALVNFIVSAVSGVGGQPQWSENGVVKNQVNGDTIEIGSPVRIVGVPEPTSLGLLGLGALGLLRRRRA
jgi:hypothetical protein